MVELLNRDGLVHPGKGLGRQVITRAGGDGLMHAFGLHPEVEVEMGDLEEKKPRIVK